MKCQHCGGEMAQKEQVNKDYRLQSAGCLLVLLGFCLLWFFPLGTIAGLLIIVASTRLGYNKRSVWCCQQCGFYFEYAK